MTTPTIFTRPLSATCGRILNGTIRISGQLFAGLTLLTTHFTAQAQVQIPPDINLFGDEIVRKITINRGAVLFLPPADTGEKPTAKVEGWPHTLVFHNGQQLRGEIIALTKDEILWKHPDASEPLRFRCDEVRRVTLSPSSESRSYFAISGQYRPRENNTKSGSATVKLSGADWLHGELSSPDGQTFALKLGDGTELPLKREGISWLCFAENPTPAYGFSGSPLDLEGWLSRAPAAQLTMENGSLSIRGANVIGRGFRPVSRVELNFELPEGGEDGLRIWLQPMGAEVNSYTTGTVEMQLGNRAFTHCIYTKQLEHVNTLIPRNESEAPGPVRYRILYDGVAQELTVFRNGQRLGNWDFVDEKDRTQYLNAVFQITGICFQYQPEGKSEGLRFNSLSVQPWDGEPSAENTVSGEGDCVFSLGGRSRVGHLNALSSTEVVFSGEKLERRPEMFLRFAQDPAPLPDANAMLLFGEQGEVSVAGLEISDGKARCRTTFASSLETPITAIKSIAFSKPANSAPIPRQPDTLVFKNGDEIAGSLVSAAKGEAWRWRTVSGQEISFGPEHIAGVRIGGDSKQAATPDNMSMVELRNGDCIRGDLVGLGADKVQFRHAQFGPLTLDYSQLWSLYPSNRLPVYNGAIHPKEWMRYGSQSDGTDEETSSPRDYSQWIYLDGHYILRARPGGYFYDPSLRLTAPSRQLPECFEFRCDFTHATGGEPDLNLQLSSKDVGTVQASIAYGRVNLFSFSRKAGVRPVSKQVTLYDKLPDPSTRRNLRLFVNSRAGTADIFIDGVPIIKVGQQEAERLPGLGENIGVSPSNPGAGALIISNLWLGPWNGELPEPDAGDAPMTSLSNGDSSSGTPTGLHEGKLQIDSEVGPLDLPIDKVLAVRFGGALSPRQVSARIRLADGSAIHVDDFRWENGAVRAHSETLGDLHLPVNLVSELALNPAPARTPKIAAPKGQAQKPAAKADRAAPANATP